MEHLTTIADLREHLDDETGNTSIGLVPTMGNLHEGHVALVRAARRECDIVVVTIFVNPTQFGPNEDFDSYPRTLEEDAAALKAAGTDVLFAPDAREVYPDGNDAPTVVSVRALSETLCGASRPGHFDGVTTVVAKLFNMARPDRAYFGEKDWQQLTIIRRMVRDLNMPVTIVGHPTVRADSGLALSSRNRYLSAEELAVAPELFHTISDLAQAISDGRTDFAILEVEGCIRLEGSGFEVDYVAVRDADSLEPIRKEPAKVNTKNLRILAAARLGGARLIDNVGLDR